MIKKMKKCIIGLLSMAFSLTLALGFTACVENNVDSSVNDEYIIPDYNLSAPQTLAMTLGDETVLAPVYDEREGLSLTFTSADPTVVSVSEGGVLSALKEGSTTITVAYGEKAVQTAVSVSLNDKLPRLHYVQDFSGGVNIAYNDSFSFTPEVYFNGKLFGDAIVSYTLADETLGTFDENGTFTPSKNGSSTVTIQATWRGVTCDDMVKTIQITVVDAVEMFVNDGTKDSFTLYTVENFGGEEYQMKTPFVVTAKVNGESVTPEIEILSGSEAITYESGEITAVKEGEAKVKVTIQTQSGEVSRIYDVSVVLPTLAYEKTLNFSAADGELPIETLFWADAKIVKAYQGETALTVENNKVLGVRPNIVGDATDGNIEPNAVTLKETQIVVYTEKAARVLTLNAYTKLIDDASDLYDLALSSQNQLVKDGLITGYFGLACDVVCDEDFVPATHDDALMTNNKSGFYGVFNGNGYRLEVPTYKKGGLFGRLGKAYICNLSVTFNEKAGGDSSTAGFAYSLGNGGWSRRVLFENVEIFYNGLGAATTNGNASYVLADRAPLWFTLRNTVIWIDQAATNRTSALLAAASDFGYDTNGNQWCNVFENTYVVTESDLPLFASSRHQCWAANDGKTENVYPNLIRANNTNDLSRAEIYGGNMEYASFKLASVWEVRNGIPTWKSKNEADYVQVLMDGVALNQSTTLKYGVKGALTLFVGNEQINGATYNVQSSNQAVTVSQSGELMATEIGEAVIEVAYTLDAENQTKTYQIVVPSPFKNVKIAEFSAYDGTIDWSFIGDETIVSAKQGETTLIADKANGTLKGVVPNITAGSYTGADVFSNSNVEPQDRKVSPVNIIVETSGGLYNLEIMAYTRVIKTADQLATFNISTVDTDFLKTDASGARTIDGYFLLGADITSDSFVNAHEFVSYSNNEWYNCRTSGFRGVFDGNGHTISVPSSAKGLFGATVRSCIKNTKFVFTETATSGGIGLAHWMPGAGWSQRGVLTDVTVTVNGFGASNANGAKSAAIAHQLGQQYTLTNITVNINYAEGVAAKKTTGILANHVNGDLSANTATSNITVVESEASSAALAYSQSNSGVETFFWASNDGKTANTANKVIASATRKVKAA